MNVLGLLLTITLIVDLWLSSDGFTSNIHNELSSASRRHNQTPSLLHGMKRPILDTLASALFRLETARVDASSEVDEQGRSGEPMAWSESNSFANQFSELFASNELGYKFKQFVAEIVAGDYDEDAIQSKVDEFIAGDKAKQTNQARVAMFSFTTCPFCRRAKDYLDQNGITYSSMELDELEGNQGNQIRAMLGKMTKRTSVPSIFIDGTHIGGCNDGPGLLPLGESGKLDELMKPTKNRESRRSFLAAFLATASLPHFTGKDNDRERLGPSPAVAEDASAACTKNQSLFTRQQFLSKQDISYQLKMPSAFKESAKPVKTHLDEVNLVSESTKGYQYGITVDPVRISSLREFGTPEEVAARVVTAEVNRDGVFEVTLLEDPIETTTTSGTSSAYVLEYLSDGKRGKKIYLNKIVVSRNKLLYVLTAQCKLDDYPTVKQEMEQVVESFQVSSRH